MKPQYEPKTVEQALVYLVEECGEVLAAVGKTQRWGLDSTNPEILPERRQRNGAWILHELVDLEAALHRARGFLHRLGYSEAEQPGFGSPGVPIGHATRASDF
jgi:hypothetical protein